MELDQVRTLAERVRAEAGKAIVGHAETLDLMLVALFSGGHILLEGPPGTAKTLLAHCFARTLAMQFGRIQFTPDLMPGDIIGTNLFNFQTSRFTLTKGPVFCDILLADEINRTPPKTQAALLEAMQERQVTLDGERHVLGKRFTVIATQNPIEQQGTYPLPEAQLDRFLFKQTLAYPDQQQEERIVAEHGLRIGMPDPDVLGIQPVANAGDVEAAVELISSIRLSVPVVGYIVRIIRATRSSPEITYGASPRAGAMLASAARARAVLEGRGYVIPDDVKALAFPVLRHRIVLSAAAEIDGRRPDDVARTLVERVDAAR